MNLKFIFPIIITAAIMIAAPLTLFAQIPPPPSPVAPSFDSLDAPIPPPGPTPESPESSSTSGITIKRIFGRLIEIIGLIIPLLVLAATVLLLYGITRYIISGEDEKKVQEARNMIIYGIISLATMTVMWALVHLLASAIFGTSQLPGIPEPNLDVFN